jgi:uncharacterized PurR-regulated membrane protein YhhQ (DUF165 family)
MSLPFGLSVDVGVLIGIYPLMYVISDITQEIYGYKYSRLNSVFAVAACLFMSVSIWISSLFPSIEDPMQLDNLSNIVFSTLLLSLFAFYVADWINDIIFEKLRKPNISFIQRAIQSSFVGEFFDAFLFMSIYSFFVWHLTARELIITVITSSLIKIFWECICSPVSNCLINYIRRQHANN